jgi:PAS domain S-box-containing protein
MAPTEGRGARELERVRAASDYCLIHQDGVIRAMSEPLAEFLGYDRGDECVGLTALSLVHDDDRPYIAERIQHIYMVHEATRPALQRLLRKDGKATFAEIYSVPITIDARVAALTIVKPRD